MFWLLSCTHVVNIYIWAMRCSEQCCGFGSASFLGGRMPILIRVKSRIRIRIKAKSRIRIRIEEKNSRAVEAQNGAIGGPWALTLEAWRPKPNPHLSEERDPGPQHLDADQHWFRSPFTLPKNGIPLSWLYTTVYDNTHKLKYSYHIGVPYVKFLGQAVHNWSRGKINT